MGIPRSSKFDELLYSGALKFATTYHEIQRVRYDFLDRCPFPITPNQDCAALKRSAMRVFIEDRAESFLVVTEPQPM
jgi:hypothetical protein